jgi:hypothetical protein
MPDQLLARLWMLALGEARELLLANLSMQLGGRRRAKGLRLSGFPYSNLRSPPDYAFLPDFFS